MLKVRHVHAGPARVFEPLVPVRSAPRARGRGVTPESYVHVCTSVWLGGGEGAGGDGAVRLGRRELSGAILW